jgi:hypothetical protein
MRRRVVQDAALVDRVAERAVQHGVDTPDGGRPTPGGLQVVHELRRHRRDGAGPGAAGLHVRTIELLEAGWRRPSTVSTWKLARALRPRGSRRDRVALDEQLRRAAGESLRVAATRPHRAREATRTELLAEAGSGPVLGDRDDLGAAILAELSNPLGRESG